MRTIHKLLILLLEQLSEYIIKPNTGGMCLIILDLYYTSLLTWDEYTLLLNYIVDDKHNHPHEELDGYYFEEGKLEPRVKWLEEHIERTKP